MLDVVLKASRVGKSDPEAIGRLLIQNDGTGTPKVGNYDVSFMGVAPGGSALMYVARVEGFDREKGAWSLVKAALDALGIFFKEAEG